MNMLNQGPVPQGACALDTAPLLSVSIVVYRPDLAMLERTLETLAAALRRLLLAEKTPLYLIDNGAPEETARVPAAARREPFELHEIRGQGNVGYGRGHNLALEQMRSRYHLVLNPDIELNENALREALDFLEAHREAGLLTPLIRNGNGEQAFLCRRFPSVLDLFVRGFVAAPLRRPFARRLDWYEMRDVMDAGRVFWDPPIVSGCFMLFRTDTLKRLEGFDPRYFLYFEDYDLSLRTRKLARVVFVPGVEVVHHGGGAATKGRKHIMLFARSAWTFFRRFGWKWL